MTAHISIPESGRKVDTVVTLSGVPVSLRVDFEEVVSGKVEYSWWADDGIELSGEFDHIKTVKATQTGTVGCRLKCEHGFYFHVPSVDILIYTPSDDLAGV